MKVLTLKKSDGKEINNLYQPTANFPLESYDKIQLLHCIYPGNNKFLPILLKEMFALLKKNGELIITGFDKDELEKTLWWLFRRQYEIIDHNSNKDKNVLIIKKKVSLPKRNDGIDHWTFGMVTNGERKDFIQKSIQSIRNLKIPNYEIIICGFYEGEISRDIHYIPFTQRDEKGWITRKKNLIAENAKYTNLCVFHDRIVFNKDWYKGMKKYGNNFEVLTCVQKIADGTRVGDWVGLNKPFRRAGIAYIIDELDYRDWDKLVYIGGMLMIIKKYIWEKIPWNEALYWRQAEDIEYSYRLTEQGYLSRFNPYSSCSALSWRFGSLPRRRFPNDNRQSWYSLTNLPIRRMIRQVNYYTSRLPIISRILFLLYCRVEKTKIYNFLINH